MSRKTYKQFNIKLSEAEHERLRKFAEREGITMSDVFHRLLATKPFMDLDDLDKTLGDQKKFDVVAKLIKQASEELERLRLK